VGLNLDAVGFRADPFTVTWTERDAILYALGVGAGQADPLAELSFTTENTSGVEQQVLPTFGIVLGQNGLLRRMPIGDYDKSKLLHGDQSIEVAGPIPPTGAASIQATVDGIYDKGSGALVVISAHASDRETGSSLWTSRLGYFLRSEGGFGGVAAPGEAWQEPIGDPDLLVNAPTRADQGLLYRLNGDRNPLHSDPAFAGRAGFERPILHGLCTYGVVHRALIGAICEGDVTTFESMYARFSRPATPGANLRTAVWRDDGGIRFRTTDDRGQVVLDRGRFDFR